MVSANAVVPLSFCPHPRPNNHVASPGIEIAMVRFFITPHTFRSYMFCETAGNPLTKTNKQTNVNTTHIMTLSLGKPKNKTKSNTCPVKLAVVLYLGIRSPKSWCCSFARHDHEVGPSQASVESRLRLCMPYS